MYILYALVAVRMHYASMSLYSLLYILFSYSQEETNTTNLVTVYRIEKRLNRKATAEQSIDTTNDTSAPVVCLNNYTIDITRKSIVLDNR